MADKPKCCWSNHDADAVNKVTLLEEADSVYEMCQQCTDEIASQWPEIKDRDKAIKIEPLP